MEGDGGNVQGRTGLPSTAESFFVSVPQQGGCKILGIGGFMYRVHFCGGVNLITWRVAYSPFDVHERSIKWARCLYNP